MAQPLDMAKTLVRSVARAFYETPAILIVDALVIHSALKDEDLRYMLGMNTKEVHKLCGKLREDRFLTSHVRPEQSNNPEQKRPINKQYYFIDYRQAIDAVKWRMYTVDKEIQGQHIPVQERKEYFCARCKAEWTQMEVLDKPSAMGFLCHNCEYPLTHDLERHSTGHQESTRLNEQFKFITDMLPRIDSVVVPENTFENAIASYIPLAPETNMGPGSAGFSSAQPTAVKGLDNVGPKSLSVNISTSDGPSEAEKAAEQARRDKVALQNALPSWMSQSTVTGESYSAAPSGPTPAIKAMEPDSKNDVKPKIAEDEESEMAAMFARIKAEQEAAAARAQEEASDDDDDDDDDEADFEDVVATGPASNNPTPTSLTPAPALKRDASSREASTDERSVKRVKVAEPEPTKADEDDESEEEIEFEDV
ncbi:transcription initiation factor IIE subunit alpha [Plectosphaerella plurivora]|uniref:Transcription initiation factor IIE subunit alpha n=1 Tax=Plectosphaerella plurivora TaxID=936078 RepID=A0A9P8V0J6_9PEZI|nr:transcription initiation factor IIE subunit alpha [Plectosphaerella plurivora]